MSYVSNRFNTTMSNINTYANIKGLRRRNAALQRNVFDGMHDSVFSVHAAPECTSSSLIGTAWLIFPSILVSCWHVIGAVNVKGIYEEAVPRDELKQQTFYVSAPALEHSLPVTVWPKRFDFDLAFLQLPQPLSRRCLQLSDHGHSDQEFCALLGYGTRGILRKETGKGSIALQSATSCLISASSDYCMSGSPVCNLDGQVIGMVTGCVGVRTHQTCMLMLPLLRLAVILCSN